MANTQINITSNGTKTLATAGKYCDRNIDVNVNVPSSGITPSGTKTITENGTHDVTSYVSAEVNVSGGGSQPTQFTNYYKPENVVLQTVSNCSSSTGAQLTTDKYVNYLIIPYHHVKNEPCVLRLRGIGTVRDRMNITFFKEDGVTAETWGQLHNCTTLTYDEYGDAVLTFDSGNVGVTREWYYIHLNFQYIGENSGVAEAKTGPIVTINEFIGNGGYVEGGN